MPTSMQLEHRLRGEDLFESLESENEEDIKVPDLEENSVLDDMIKGFISNDIIYRIGQIVLLGKSYNGCLGKVPVIYNDKIATTTYSVKDIEEFFILLNKFQDVEGFNLRVGLYSSALVNNCNEEKLVVLYTNHFGNPQDINCIGYSNIKEIIVNGHGGQVLGNSMESGKIIVNGDVGEQLGESMNGGEIVINGNAGERIASRMDGGTIYLNGEYESLSDDITGGNIYHYSKLIVKDGKEVVK